MNSIYKFPQTLFLHLLIYYSVWWGESEDNWGEFVPSLYHMDPRNQIQDCQTPLASTFTCWEISTRLFPIPSFLKTGSHCIALDGLETHYIHKEGFELRGPSVSASKGWD